MPIAKAVPDNPPNLLSLSARADTSRKASASVYGFVLLVLNRGSKIRSKKPLRVFFALRTWIDEMAHGRVEFWSI